VGGLSQLLFCCVSSDSGLGCTPSSLGKRLTTQLPPTPFYEKARWEYAKQHLLLIPNFLLIYIVGLFCFGYFECFKNKAYSYVNTLDISSYKSVANHTKC